MILLLLVSLACGCETDDGSGDDGVMPGGAGGAGSPAEPPTGDDAPPGDEPGGGDTVEPDPAGPGTEPPNLPEPMEMDGDGASEGAAGERADPEVDPSMDDTAPASGATGSDADASCDLGKTRVHLEDRAVAEGELCDDVVACVADAASATALVAAAPGFSCEEGDNPIEQCGDGETPCIWRPSVLDATEMAELCAATTVLADGDELLCIVYR